MATSELRVTESTPLGKGSYKIAFTIVRDITNAPHNFTIPAGSDVANFLFSGICKCNQLDKRVKSNYRI